jgi:predicted RNase H-like HicB family nuclease
MQRRARLATLVGEGARTNVHTQDVGQDVIYTLQLQELRPGDFVARLPAFPNMLALGDTAEQAVARATTLVSYEVRDARARGEALPADVSREPAAGRRRVSIHIAA